MTNTNFNKSIEELENDYWKDSDFETTLILKCHQYRKIPVKDLSIEQIRLLIGQNIGLSYLIPKSLELLKVNILAEGDLYEGDLLSATLTTERKFWEVNPNLKLQLLEILSSNFSLLEESDNSHLQLIKKVESFKQK